MAQPASSAQREPSMEEILASIRRIIEDNEQPQREPEFLAPDTAIGPAANDPAPTEMFSKAPEVTPDPEIAPPVLPPEVGLSKPTEIEDIDFGAIEAAAQEEVRQESDTRWDMAVLRSLDEKVAAPSKPVEQPVSAISVAPVETMETKPAIISEHAGRQVAASFGELSEAFAASRRRSFDEIAEEMMRPMLQDWLDNNLPVLVERLVREEIERVARGG